MNNNEIHIGDLILQKLKKEKRTVEWLAGEIEVEASTLRRRLKKKSIDTDLLYCISNTLHCNFFQYYHEKI
jgi:hypothetical protein